MSEAATDEPKALSAARDHLAKAEAELMTKDGLFHLQEGLALVEHVIGDRPGGRGEAVARNLGSTYAAKLYERVQRRLASRRNLPEPELEHLFAVLLSFDGTSFELPPAAPGLKIGLVKRLIDLYYEGHSPAEKQKAVEELVNIARDSDRQD